VDSIKSSVFRPSEVGEDTHPHACMDGLVFLTYTVFDEEVDDEVEKIEAIPCRRCAEEGGGYVED
jgi:hypothetical protein